ncbi:hypothetical protein CEXT_640831 [Caerostris extrusa]|uniref:Uncharacterized protein n=1 Tax=Caerostris extrusa TaxID=172846 RepID=A0AAV4MWG2_CAEEX|nr:hypothetical protein CEXT_640831 [Caerostris extrusa]
MHVLGSRINKDDLSMIEYIINSIPDNQNKTMNSSCLARRTKQQNFQKIQESADDRFVRSDILEPPVTLGNFLFFLFYVLSKSSSDRWAVLCRWLNVTCGNKDRP